MRGIDNAAYYRLVEDDPRYYMDYTGTGNSLNVRNPHTLQLIMDSLRYWVTEMHVDGFRFDLAATLAREFYDVDRLCAFFDLVQQDPVDQPGQADRRAVGRRPGRLPGRQLPAAVDGVERQVPRHRARLLARRAGHARRVRLAASPARSDLYQDDGRRPYASINFVTAHDGFTLARPGLLQRQAQRGQRRGQPRRRRRQPVVELRRRGPDRRRGGRWRCAPASGATSSPRCCCRQGVPMLLHGDELGRTQQRQQQRLLPGQRDCPGWTGRCAEQNAELLGLHRGGDRAARTTTRCSAGAGSSQGRPIAHAADELRRHRLVHARRARR